MVITINMRTTLGLALLLTLVLLANAGFPGSENEEEGSDDYHGHPPESGDSNAATALTPTIFTVGHNSQYWSAVALTGVAWAMYGA